MRPRPLHRRTDLLALVRECVPTRACGRAMDEDRATVLGGFAPPEGLPYWLVKVTSRHGRVWYIGITCDDDANRFGTIHPDRPDWEHWDGSMDGVSVRDGDDPNHYALMRAKHRRLRHGTAKASKDE